MEYNIEKAKLAQDKYCIKNKMPHFAPYNGRCYYCNYNIYDKVDKGIHSTGISIESASKGLVTGCPHCNYSYCE